MKLCVLAAVAAALGALSCASTGQEVTIKPDLATGEIDHLIRVEWNREGIVPAPKVGDAGYLRRIYLDIVGTLPPPDVVSAFMADPRHDKRERMVDQLLASPRYADHWTNYWDSVLMGHNKRLPYVDPGAFRQWLHGEFERDVPWNKFVYDLISATGQNSAGGSYRQIAMTAVSKPAPAPGAPGAVSTPTATATMQPSDTMMAPGAGASSGSTVNGAVNWYIRYLRDQPADLSGNASKIFLGVQIQCAQCHDHKTEKWKQEDFRRFTSCFLEARPLPVVRREKGQIPVFDLEDVNRPPMRRNAARKPKQLAKLNEIQKYLQSPPCALDGTDFSDTPNRRQALAAWMTADTNPWFAEAIVNRMWSHFLGRGFVEPVDDFRPSNPPVAPDVLEGLAQDFREHHYDLKHLIRLICLSQVYQISAAPARKLDQGNRYWARFRLKPLGPDEMMDCLIDATGFGPALERFAGNRLDQVKFLMQRQFSFLFDVDEEFEQKEFEGTITQALMLMNGNITNRAVTPIPGTALADTLAMPGDDDARITALYLRTLSRPPTNREEQRWLAFINTPRQVVVPQQPAAPELAQFQKPKKQKLRKNTGFDPLGGVGNRFASTASSPREQAFEDMFWALLNSSEFQFNH